MKSWHIKRYHKNMFRRQMLERDLVEIEEMLPILGVEKVILTGDMAAGDYKPDTKIELSPSRQALTTRD